MNESLESQPTSRPVSQEKKKPNARRRLFRAALFFVILGVFGALCLMAAEMAARIYSADTFGFTRPDPTLGWSYRPGHRARAVIADSDGLRKVDVRVNSLGLREREIPYENKRHAYRILIVGDSVAEGLQYPLEDIFPKRLEARLNSASSDGRPIEVINGGGGNYGTDQELLFYATEGKKYRPDLVLLFIFPLNDISDNAIGLNDRAYLPKFFFSLRDGHLADGDRLMTPPLVEELRRRNWLQRQGERFHFYHLLQFHARYYSPRLSRAFVSAGLFTPSYTRRPDDGGALFIDVFRKPLAAEWREAFALTEALVGELRDRVERDGARFCAVVVPFAEPFVAAYPERARALQPELFAADKDLGQATRLTREFLERLGVEYLDLTEALLMAMGKGEGEARRPVNIFPDGHPNLLGHKTIALAVGEFLDAKGLMNR